jgi:hypothetical protein
MRGVAPLESAAAVYLDFLGCGHDQHEADEGCKEREIETLNA